MSPVKLAKILRQSIQVLFYFLFITAPLIWVEANSELFELPKMNFVYLMSTTIVAVWITRMIVVKKILFRRSWFDYVIFAYVIGQLLATITSIHPHTSIFGYYTRFHGGLLSTFAYIGLFYAFINNFSPKETLKAISVLISSSFVSAFIAFPEHFGYAFSCLVITGNFQATCWIQDIVTRVFGTFGQPNWLAAFLITTLPLVWAQLVRYKLKLSPSYIFLLLANSMIFSVVLFTKSKSGFLGLGVGFGFFWLLMSWQYLRPKQQKTASLDQPATLSKKQQFRNTLLISLLTLVVPLLLFGSEYSPSLYQLSQKISSASNNQTPLQSKIDQAIPLIDRGGTDSGRIRQIVWEGAINMFMHNFLLGTGVETFAYSYYGYRPVEHNLVSEWDFLYNKAHNEFLNIAANTGLVGLITYLGLMVSFGYLCYQGFTHNAKQNVITKLASAIRPSKNEQLQATAPLYAGLFSGYIALGISNALGFSTVVVGILFFIYPAVAFCLLYPQPTIKSSRIPPKLHWWQIFALVILTLVYIGMITIIGRYYSADLKYAAAQKAETDNDLTTAIMRYQEAIVLSPYEARFYNEYADALSKAAYSFAATNNLEATDRFADQAILASAKTLELNPVHINFYKSQAAVFIRLAGINKDFLGVADQILENALILAPTDAKIAYNLGLLKIDQEATASAQLYFEEAIGMKPNYEAARMDLAQIYEQQGSLDQAIQQYKYVLNYIAPDNSIAIKAIDRLESNETD